MTTKKMNPDEDYEFYARPENQVPTSDRCFGMRRAAEPGTGHRAPGTGHRAPGTGHLDALLRSIENNLTARDD